MYGEETVYTHTGRYLRGEETELVLMQEQRSSVDIASSHNTRSQAIIEKCGICAG